MYMITAISPEGIVSFHSKTPAEALQTAVELIDFGLEGVCITDARGRRHIPTDFAGLYAAPMSILIEASGAPERT
jgi:predicted RNase H-like HicB family nuclease